MMVLGNVMIPSVVNHVVYMLFLLIPIAMIEAVVLARRHRLKYPDSFLLSMGANLRSTLIGLPPGYACALIGVIPAGIFLGLLPGDTASGIGMILGSVVGQGRTRPNELDHVGYYLGTLLVMIPYFLVTLWIERRAIAKRKPELDTPALTTTVRIMNDITYGLLAIPIIAGAFKAVMELRSGH